MIPDDHDRPFFCPSMFPVERALVETRTLPRSSLFRAWRPRQKNWHAGLKGNGTRRAQALLKRLDVKVTTTRKK